MHVTMRTAPGEPMVDRRNLLCAWGAWLVLVCGLVPHQLARILSGVDGSWVWGINAVAGTGALPGRDYAFTYGPLGSVVLAVAAGAPLRGVAAGRFALHLVFALALAAALRGRPAGRIAGFTLAVLVGCALGGTYEVQLLFWLGLLFAVAILDHRMRRIAGPACAVVAVIFLLLKISLGVCALTLLLGYGLWLGLAQRAWIDLACLVVAFAAAAGTAVALCFGSLDSLRAWIGAERGFLAGMSVAMSLEGPWPELLAGATCLAAFTALAAGAMLFRGRLAAYLGIATPVVWLVFRHGFVRQDGGHVVIFFGTVVLLLAIGILFAGTARELAAAGATAAVVCIVACGSTMFHGSVTVESMSRALDGLVHPRRAWGVALGMWSAGPGSPDKRRVLDDQLAPTWSAALRAARAGVDAVPFELSLLAANDLRWVPGPTLELELAYTAELDLRCARHFAGAGAPDVLLARYESIDGRHPVWGAPATWTAILQGYAPVPSPRPDVVVLRRRARPASFRWSDAGQTRFAVGDWVDVPAVDGLLFGEVDLRPSAAGRLQAALWRVPPVQAAVELSNGRRKRWRIIPDTARNGLLLCPLPRNPADFPLIFETDGASRYLPRVVRIRITGPGTGCFQKAAALTWRVARRG